MILTRPLLSALERRIMLFVIMTEQSLLPLNVGRILNSTQPAFTIIQCKVSVFLFIVQYYSSGGQ